MTNEQKAIAKHLARNTNCSYKKICEGTAKKYIRLARRVKK